MNYQMRREDGTIHDTGLTQDAVVRFAECLGYDAKAFRSKLTRHGFAIVQDDVGEMHVETETPSTKNEGKVYSRGNFYFCMVGGVEFGAWRARGEATAGLKVEQARAAKKAKA